MSYQGLQNRLQQLFQQAGIRVDGNRPWDIQVHNSQLSKRILSDGALGLGESYVEGWWDCPRLEEFCKRILQARLNHTVLSWRDYWGILKARVLNLQKFSRAFQVGQQHYDIGNRLYECMLGERMVYSCGYWKDADTLDEAQDDKLDLVCRKLDLQPGMRVLDIGCGWGEAAKYAATNYGCEVVGVTISAEQVAYG